MDRRDFLKVFAGGGLTLGSWKAVDNVLLGYGKNLESQNLSELVSTGLYPSDYDVRDSGYTVSLDTTRLTVKDGGVVEEFDYWEVSRDDAVRIEDELGLESSPLSELVADLPALTASEYEFEFHDFDGFFERLTNSETRPHSVGALRGDWSEIDASVVEEFTGTDPSNPRALLESLKPAFIRATSYDFPRYIAGALTDNVFMGTVRLRRFFEHDVGYDALVSDPETRMFCYEYNARTVEALHSVSPHRQSYPVVGARINDFRHKHVYTGVASVVRDGGLKIPMTFVDYTRPTLYDNLGLSGLLGSSVNAYDSQHRASTVDWSRNS